MKRILVVVAACFAASALAAQEPLCATGGRTDEILDYLQERADHQPRDRARVLESTLSLRDNTFTMNASENGVAVNGHANNLIGQTIELTPSDATHYTLRHIGYTYVEPVTNPLRVFTATGAHYVKYDITTSTPLTLFGNSVTTLYFSQFNGIHLKPPADVLGYQVDALHAFVQNDAVLSPLLITKTRPGALALPTLFVEERENSLIATWRSDGTGTFAYEVQARLFTDGRIHYSYRSARAMRWGAPVISAGVANLRATTMVAVTDATNEINTPTNALLKPMVDFASVDISRISDSEMLRVQLKLNGAIDPSKLASDEFLRYIIVFGQSGSMFFDVKADGTTQAAAIGANFVAGDNVASYSGNTVTFYVSQSTLPVTSGNVTFSAFARVGASRTYDTLTAVPNLTAPPRSFVSDFATVANGTSLEVPFSDPFTLPTLNPQAAWTAIKARYGLTDSDIDGVAVYQSFFTDLIFYAGAYETSANPQVDGIALPSSTYGGGAPRHAAVMHMNTLGYGWNTTDELTSHVIMHEFGHRWLYFIRIMEGGSVTNSLNPVSAHPAQYIDTPAAFSVFHDYDASVMGGGLFTPNSDGTYHVRSANRGYSWTDLYLMGLAAPSEVPPWFYIANSNPALGLEYYPPDNINVSGTRTSVTIQQVIDAVGARNPTMANSPKSFRVLFVLVTDDGVEPTADQMASMKNIRALFEKNFSVATGRRAEVHTDFSSVPRRRGVAH